MKLSYINSEMSDDFEEALRLGAEAGVTTVNLRKNIFGKDIEFVGEDEIHRAKMMLAKFGMEIGVLMPPFGKCDINDPGIIREHHEIFKRVVDTAHSFGTSLIRCFSFTGAGPETFDDHLGRIVDNLRPAVDRAEAENVIMCFEVVANTIGRTAAHTRKVVDALDSSAAAAIWEINVSWNGGEKPSEGHPHLKGHIRDIHVKPNSAGELDPVGESGETYADIVRWLSEDGYAGVITIEHWPGTEGTLKGLAQFGDVLQGAIA